jgi:hypothetical protein
MLHAADGMPPAAGKAIGRAPNTIEAPGDGEHPPPRDLRSSIAAAIPTTP